MIKNLCKLFLFVILLSGSVFAQEYQTVRAEHILVKTAAEAQEIKKAIDDGGDFEYYARAYSLCPSGRNGEFEKAAFETPVGEVSKPVYTQFGWHLIKVLDKK